MQLPDFGTAKVMVVGDLMLDRYWQGPTGRISPEAPVPVVKIEGSEDRPGGAANVAMNLAALGAKVTLAGLTGDDESADLLEERLTSLGIDSALVREPSLETITKLRVMSRNQQLIRLDFEQDYAQVDKQALHSMVEQRLADVDVVLLSDYAKGALSDVQSLISMAKSMGKVVLVDPKGSDFHKYRGASLLTPNMSEFEAVAGHCDSEQALVERAQALVKDYDFEGLLVTRSENGMTLLKGEGSEWHLPAKAKEVYDVTGAGDTVIATLAASIAAGCDWQKAAVLANAAAGVVVGKLGTSTVNANELAMAVLADNRVGTGVMSQEQLVMAVQEAQKRGENIVMTNGCFDILHAGHVSYLQNAKALGDRLIVAVNADESVTQLKGPGRPVNGLDRRMSVLAALASVDWVVPFSEETPERLISEVLPNLLVKGGDYKPEDIAGGKQVIANGGEVKVLNFEDGISTTGIIEKITQSD